MNDIYYKTTLLLGEEAVKKLKSSCAAVIGLGGVGGFAAEALVRSGIGAVILIDKDTTEPSNLNRQIYALSSNIGMSKAQLASQRTEQINPNCKVTAVNERFCDENADSFGLEKADYIIDAIDSVEDKITLVKYASEHNIPLISSMGTGNRTDITRLKYGDIYSTAGCPLAKAVRKRCREEGIKALRVVFSDEIPAIRPPEPSSMIFVPAAAGLMLAREVILKLSETNS